MKLYVDQVDTWHCRDKTDKTKYNYSNSSLKELMKHIFHLQLVTINDLKKPKPYLRKYVMLCLDKDITWENIYVCFPSSLAFHV